MKENIDKRRKQVLIIECDSSTLEAQNLAVGSEIKNAIRKRFPKNGIDLIEIVEKDAFDGELDVVLRKYKMPCKTIILIGHSNENGIKLTTNIFMNWTELGCMLEPFAPEKLIFLACRAGDIKACEIMFENIPSLRQIFASPVNISKFQHNIIVQKVLLTLSSQKENQFLVNFMQTVNALVTKEWMFSRTREEYEYGELGSKHLFETGLIAITNWLK
jgi:hypothetical protein